MRVGETVVVALGGNAILRPGQKGTAAEQYDNIRSTCYAIASMIHNGSNVIITHGNGPQVGNILIQNEEASGIAPPMPLDVCGASSQGLIGYMIQQVLGNTLRNLGDQRPVATIITQTIVDPVDPAFANPAKPIGPFFTRERAFRLMAEKGFIMKEDAGRGWRRVVPSPNPVRIVEREIIKNLVSSGAVVIASGGGGIPVAVNQDGYLQGVEAVIDKDLAAERLAEDVGASVLVILTDVSHVVLNYKTPQEKPLAKITARECRSYITEGHFKEGSMKPKVLAALRFVESGGKRAAIGSLEDATNVFEGKTGTQVLPD